MELLATLLLFGCVAAVCAFAGVRLWARPRTAIERIAGRAPDGPPAALASLRKAIERLGAARARKLQDAGLLERQLVRAGFRHAGALRLFHGSRLALAAGSTLAALLLLADADLELGRKLLVLALAAFAGYSAPARYLRIRTNRRRRKIARGLPDALDLLVVCVESGLGLDQAMLQTAREMETARPEISEEFSLANYELRGGKRRAEALRGMAERAGVDDLSKLATVLIQADRFGTSIAQTLRGQSDYMRLHARQRAEEKASKLGVKLVFPIFFCILPSLFVVTVGPVFAKVCRELIPMLNGV